MKGSKCPACSELTFHTRKGVFECSTCSAVGWIREPPAPGGGRGSACNLCGVKTVRQIYKGKGITVAHCYSCKATTIK